MDVDKRDRFQDGSCKQFHCVRWEPSSSGGCQLGDGEKQVVGGLAEGDRASEQQIGYWRTAICKPQVKQWVACFVSVVCYKGVYERERSMRSFSGSFIRSVQLTTSEMWSFVTLFKVMVISGIDESAAAHCVTANNNNNNNKWLYCNHSQTAMKEQLPRRTALYIIELRTQITSLGMQAKYNQI